MATSITQDADGFIWVGTFGGLNRFDGRSFSSYTTRQGLRHNLIQALFVDSENRLWAGDQAGGLTLMQDGKVLRTFAPPGEERGSVNSIVQVGDTLYIASLPSGFAVLSLSDMDAGIQAIPDTPAEGSFVLPSGDGGVYLVSSYGLYLHQGGIASPSTRLIKADVTAIRSTKSGRVVVGDRRGRIGWLDGESIEWLDVEYDGTVLDILIKDESIEWVVLEGKGMLPYASTEGNYLLPGDGITTQSMYDAEGVLWSPTRRGLARYLGSRFRHYPLEFKGVIPEVFAIRPGTEQDFWLGTSIGLLHLDREGRLSNVSDELSIKRAEVREVRISSDGSTLWFSHTLAPIYALDLKTLRIAKAIGSDASATMSLTLDSQDRLWAGSYQGVLNVYELNSDRTRAFDIGQGASIYGMAMADDGYLWFGANHRGLYRIDTRDDSATPELMVDAQTMGRDFFAHVVVRGVGSFSTVWVSSLEGGVFRYRNGEIEQVITDKSITDYIIYSLQPLADNTVVLVTNRGVFRYSLESKVLEQYTALDGFVAIEGKVHANYYEGERLMLIGTTSGLTVMDVSLPMHGVGVPRPLITNRLVDDTAVAGTDKVPGNASFEKVLIGFTAISTRNPSGVEFSYRLVGEDANWSLPGEAMSISYSKLSPGDHRFELRARLPGGEWSPATSWPFTVPTPYWRTWWFISLVLISVFALGRTLVKLRLRAIAATNERLREEVVERTRSIEKGRLKLEQANDQLSKEIQERQKADALREEVETRFQQAYQNSPIGMALVDPEGLVYNANPKMKHMFWPDSKQEQREPLIQVIAEKDRADFARFLVDCASGVSEDSRMEAGCIGSDGRERTIDFRPAAIRDADGQLKHIVLLAHDVTESRAMTTQLEYQASFDELTGLINRRAFAQRLEEVGAESRAGVEAFLMFLDLDQFKVVNDTCGHAAGDDLLQKVGHLLTEFVREQDIVARLGGDEFGIILVNCTQDVALQRAELLRQQVENLEFLWDQEIFRIGVSIGVVPMASASRDLNELQQVADAACYAAKEAGRNRVHLVSGTEDAVHERRGEMRWVQRLNNAIDNDDFVLFGQRIAPLHDDPGLQERIEVLLRMRDRESDRLIPPGAFLPAAERYGLQGRLDLWVLNNVIEMLKRHEKSSIAKHRIWVNLSGATIGDPRISRDFIQRIEDAAFPAGSLNFEITETAVIRNIDAATAMIKTLQNMGCRFALDDFGSGLSSFGYLRKLNVDYLKIDGQFVRDIASDTTDRTFVRSIIDIAHSLGMLVVAEFVESQDILQLVKELGSDAAQGFHIHRPEPLEGLLPGTISTATASNSTIASLPAADQSA